MWFISTLAGDTDIWRYFSCQNLLKNIKYIMKIAHYMKTEQKSRVQLTCIRMGQIFCLCTTAPRVFFVPQPTQLHRLFSNPMCWHKGELCFHSTSFATWRSLGSNEGDRSFGRTPHSGHLGVTGFLLPLDFFASAYIFFNVLSAYKQWFKIWILTLYALY